VAVPYLVVGLDSNNSSQRLAGSFFWDNEFSFATDYLNNSVEKIYFHPFKFSWLESRVEDQGPGFCQYYLKDKLENF
jgi:hypothetical protein